MLQPTRTKFRKAHKGRIHGIAGRGEVLNFGAYGLKAMQPERIISKQIEAARVLAERILKRQILTLRDQFNALGKQVLSRPFNNQEQILLAKLLREHIEEFESNPIEANKLVSIGITPYTTEIPKVELAAWISVTRAVLNLHETITRN